MEVMKVCRICSIVDVKLHDLRSYPLESYYESVIGINPQYTNLPPYACYECATLVRKFYFFKQKCLRSHAVLSGTTDAFGKIQPQEVRLIDREGLHISSNLNITKLPNIEIETPTPQINKQITHEPGTEDDIFKIGDHDYALTSMDPSLSSDDDESQSLHNETKSQNEDSDTEMVELEEEYEGLAFAVGTEDYGHLIEVPQVVTTEKKRHLNKGGFHKKKFINPSLASEGKDDFALYMNVITLTLEEQKEEILKRKESSNYLNSPFKCDLCFKGFLDNETWNHHVSKHSENAGSIECKVCKCRFKTKRACHRHKYIHEKRYICKLCPYTCINKNNAKQHQARHKGFTFKCKYCSEMFTIWTSYLSHVRIKHPSEFICGFCGYSFISKTGLSLHKSMMHKDIEENAEENKEDGPYCEECDVKFISMEAYKRHTVMSVKHTQTTDSIKGCRICGATFEDSEQLRLHNREEHKRQIQPRIRRKYLNKAQRSWPTKCEHCPEEIPNAREYWNHFRRKHRDKNYPIQKDYMCDICGKRFRGNATLTYHKRIHFNDRPYKCSQCDKAFCSSTTLHIHEQSHSDNRPYPCAVCSKAFKGKHALERHVRIHTGQKPYECEICGKRFSQSNSKKLHVHMVHLKLPSPYVNRKPVERRKQAPKDSPAEQYIYYIE